jgi:hypothetical protein
MLVPRKEGLCTGKRAHEPSMTKVSSAKSSSCVGGPEEKITSIIL